MVAAVADFAPCAPPPHTELDSSESSCDRTRELVDPVLAHAALKQREYRALQMLLQDILYERALETSTA